ncbi:hypothetical protein BASA50_004515 [Batrachochytrium salamandrivorans]|uniref:Uncharacterized protein n=1 Tax=Batrachochytrium salamandrivorans TaxID=1357716 RepID=A0ABQ8FIA1_9FUNG|nr:hypothetical protein BASA50_004515 [Batrachochytrium salamandrivorans]
MCESNQFLLKADYQDVLLLPSSDRHSTLVTYNILSDMKVAAATIISFIVASTYASPAAYSANQEVNTHGSTIASSANAHLEKRGGGLHGDMHKERREPRPTTQRSESCIPSGKRTSATSSEA